MIINAATGIEDEISAIQSYYIYGKIQDEIQAIANNLNPNDFKNTHDYVEAYRSLAYTYLLCAAKATSSFKDLNGYDQNMRISAEAAIIQTMSNVMVANVTSSEEPFASITNYAFPSIISKGDKFVTYGDVNSINGEPLETVEIIVYSNSEGKRTILPAVSGVLAFSTHYNLLELDSQLEYNMLDPGTYTMQIYAGKHQLIYESSFIVLEEDGIFKISNYKLPYPRAQGNPFSISGIVTSSNELSTVRVTIIDEFNNNVYGGVYPASDFSFDISSVDQELLFDHLNIGKYYYVIEATDILRNTETLINQPFYIY